MSLVLKVVKHDGTAHGGFQWNTEVGAVNAAPDWNPKPVCGGGLHGWLYGEGDLSASTLVDEEGAVWMVLDVDENTIVPLDGKVKFPSAKVVLKADRSECANYIAAHDKNACTVHFVSLTGGYKATLTGGDEATLTGGDEATLTGGDKATLTGGNWATLTGGDEATLTGGYKATLTGGNWATLTGGDEATLTGGDEATLIFRWWDGKRKRITVGYVGEDGIKPNVPYVCIDGIIKENA